MRPACLEMHRETWCLKKGRISPRSWPIFRRSLSLQRYQGACVDFLFEWRNLMLTTSKYTMHGSSTRCTFCKKPFCTRGGYVEFWRASNGEHFCSEFVRTMLRKRGFGCSIPPRLQVLRPPIQPNHSYLISGAALMTNEASPQTDEVYGRLR